MSASCWGCATASRCCWARRATPPPPGRRTRTSTRTTAAALAAPTTNTRRTSMQWRDLMQCLITYINEKLHRVEASPQVSRALVVMDTGIQYMADKHYESRNPALAAVRAPLVVGLWVML